ncbi:hypothetical protein K4A83_11950 [Spirulina subsalsa FACHB-351]|uniref:Uncharacterized protein n=1 Tax=Spirulina subsalsa FACHB-351 TaxID=234711 RepID=A0ABT3L711_9CYAN|nr:hypothetical protein [Spirulina subsalsa]MCW6036972.1 hypothetical protein [Spirulina subsalsa FACHB-351]
MTPETSNTPDSSKPYTPDFQNLDSSFEHSPTAVPETPVVEIPPEDIEALMAYLNTIKAFTQLAQSSFILPPRAKENLPKLTEKLNNLPEETPKAVARAINIWCNGQGSPDLLTDLNDRESNLSRQESSDSPPGAEGLKQQIAESIVALKQVLPPA